MLSGILLIFIFSVFVCLKWYRYARPRGFPPGPIGLPLFGNLLTFRKSPLVSMMRWKKEYGDIVGLNLGQFRAVLISNYDLLKEAFNNENFNGRPDFKPALLFTGGEAQGTLTSDGDTWSTIRRFTVKNLNDLGFGKKSAESMIQEDVEEIIQNLLKHDLNHPISFQDKFYVPVGNHLWNILCWRHIHGQ